MTLSQSSANDLRTLSRQARALADACEAGTAPAFGVGDFRNLDGSPCCAVGHAMAGLSPCVLATPAIESPKGLPDPVWHARDAVISANDESHPKARHAAVIAPLRAFADAVDAKAG